MDDTVFNCTLEGHDVICNGIKYRGEELFKPTNGFFWMYLLLYGLLVVFAGLMSGLTLGLLSLDTMSLMVLKRGGKPKERRYAKRILWIVRHHHLLLVTLLVSNAAAVETMPIFLSKITNEIVAIIISVTAVLVFGEIIPQALCTRFGLAIGYYCSPLVVMLMALSFPIAFPIAKVLDCVLGKDHGTFYRRAELRELVKIHATHPKSNEEPLSYDEALIVKCALEMRDKTVKDAMTPLESVYMLDISETFSRKALREIVHHGHSRIPVYKGSRDNVCGLLLTKRLIGIDLDNATPISTLPGVQTPPPSCLTTTSLYDLLNMFQTGRSHLFLVYEEETENSEPVLVGVITLEDVIEELIGEEIVDETDVYIDVHKRIAVARAKLAKLDRQSVSDYPSRRRSRPQSIQRSHSENAGAGGTLESGASNKKVGLQIEESVQNVSSSAPSHVTETIHESRPIERIESLNFSEDIPLIAETD